MKYADSQRDVETITATGTTYSSWMDISWANEIYSFIDLSASETYDAETLDVTLERYVPYPAATATTVLTHTQLTADGTEEKYGVWHDGSAPGAENKLGMRVRWKYVAGGTFAADQILTVTMVLHAKRN